MAKTSLTSALKTNHSWSTL